MVAVPRLAREAPVISKERWEELCRMRADGQSVPQIPCSTGLDCRTVPSALAKPQVPLIDYQRP